MSIANHPDSTSATENATPAAELESPEMLIIKEQFGKKLRVLMRFASVKYPGRSIDPRCANAIREQRLEVEKMLRIIELSSRGSLKKIHPLNEVLSFPHDGFGLKAIVLENMIHKVLDNKASEATRARRQSSESLTDLYKQYEDLKKSWLISVATSPS